MKKFLASLLLTQTALSEVDMTDFWRLLSTYDDPVSSHRFQNMVIEEPSVLRMRSGDGRGILWWAWEFGNAEALAFLKAAGLNIFESDLTDKAGKTPQELCQNDCEVDKVKQHIEQQTDKAYTRYQELKSLHEAVLSNAFDLNEQDAFSEIEPEYGIDDDDL